MAPLFVLFIGSWRRLILFLLVRRNESSLCILPAVSGRSNPLYIFFSAGYSDRRRRVFGSIGRLYIGSTPQPDRFIPVQWTHTAYVSFLTSLYNINLFEFYYIYLYTLYV